MDSRISQSTEAFFQFDLMWVGVSIQAQEVKIWFSWNSMHAIGSLLVVCKGKARSISILIRVKEYVGAVVFVVTDKLAMYWESLAFTHSRAHLYGCSFSIFDLAQVCKLKGPIFAAMLYSARDLAVSKPIVESRQG